ncbi:Hypothetical protein SMAX5B_005209 [Scophthalmus maximus]|uniref:Uncharacterized protein n=1 Tax=Scophthalmus maximus TaxID=52904 RepID=A0A2U9BFK7_SCOMX|nr:Hypothetical protein SMAX5B_005209 [Scophthalmus maximus]
MWESSPVLEHCTERLGGRDPDVILRQGSPVNNNPLEYQPHRRRAPLRGPWLPSVVDCYSVMPPATATASVFRCHEAA